MCLKIYYFAPVISVYRPALYIYLQIKKIITRLLKIWEALNVTNKINTKNSMMFHLRKVLICVKRFLHRI